MPHRGHPQAGQRGQRLRRPFRACCRRVRRVRSHPRAGTSERVSSVSHGLYVPLLKAPTLERVTLQNLAAWSGCCLLMPSSRTSRVRRFAGGGCLAPEFVPVFVAMPERARDRAVLVSCALASSGYPLRAHPWRSRRVGSRDRAASRPRPRLVRPDRPGRRPRYAEAARPPHSGATVRLGRPGVRPLRAAARGQTSAAESPYEILLMFFHELAGITVEPQVEVFDDDRTPSRTC